MKNTLRISITIFLLWCASVAGAQEQVVSGDTTDAYNASRMRGLVIGSGTAYIGGMYALHRLWYSDFSTTSFRFFNDNAEWKQMDKAGHFYSAFHLSQGTYQGIKWTGSDEQKALFWGSMTGWLVLAPIEIFDGYSEGFGFSWGDMAANLGGSAFFYGQHMLWDEVRIHPKFSFSRSGLAQERPELLGSNLQEQIIKDYNGQTYWFSFDLSKFMKNHDRFPGWLNIAAGYGANNMVFARDEQNLEAGFDPYRRYYLSLDLDLTHFRGESKWLNTLIFIGNMIKIPAPAVEMSRNGVTFHWLKF